MSRLDAPRLPLTFRQMIGDLDRALYGPTCPVPARQTLEVMLSCIREQQAALQLLINSCDTQVRNKDGEQMGVRTPDRPTVAQARAVLAKYALEKS